MYSVISRRTKSSTVYIKNSRNLTIDTCSLDKPPIKDEVVVLSISVGVEIQKKTKKTLHYENVEKWYILFIQRDNDKLLNRNNQEQ